MMAVAVAEAPHVSAFADATHRRTRASMASRASVSAAVKIRRNII